MKASNISIVSGISPPPLIVMTLQTRTAVNPKTHQNEIVMVSGLVHQKFCLDKAPPKPLFQYHFCTKKFVDTSR